MTPANDNVISISGRPLSAATQPNEQVISALEMMLDAAKSGQIQQVVAVWVDAQGMPRDLCQGSGEAWQVMAMIGGLELCKATLVKCLNGDVQ